MRCDHLHQSAAESLFGLSRHHARASPCPSGGALREHEPRLRRAPGNGSGFIERELKLHRSGEEPIPSIAPSTPLLGASRG